MEEALLEEILKQLRVTNRLLATLRFEHMTTLKSQGYDRDNFPLKKLEIKEFIKEIEADII